jgi:hypothetical protein
MEDKYKWAAQGAMMMVFEQIGQRFQLFMQTIDPNA